MSKTKLNILFLVHTEYHMMVTLSLIANKYDNSNDYNINICQTENFSKTRFQFDKNIKLLNHVSYNILKYDEELLKYNKEIVTFINSQLIVRIDLFFMFNHHAFLPIYLAKQLYKKGAEIYLGPDGLKPYSSSKRLTPRWSIKTAIRFYKFLKINKLSFVWNFPTLSYGNLKEIKKVIVQYPENYNNISNKEIEKVEILTSIKSIKLTYSYFNFNIHEELSEFSKNIFYINQPFKDQSIYDFEIECIKRIQVRLPGYKLIIKLHPLTENVQKQRFNELKNVQLLTKSYPAELYIAKLKNSIVLSFWSTGCLINNVKTRMYWLYPTLIKRNIMLNYVKIINPTNHIKEIVEIDEII